VVATEHVQTARTHPNFSDHAPYIYRRRNFFLRKRAISEGMLEGVAGRCSR
jgi:hypothetical protein